MKRNHALFAVQLALITTTIVAFGCTPSKPGNQQTILGAFENLQDLAGSLSGIMATNPDGSWRVSWAEIEQAVAKATPVPERGEQSHLLKPIEYGSTPVYADITPFAETPALPLADLEQGRIIAIIRSSGDYDGLGLKIGVNYFGAWHDSGSDGQGSWHGFVVNPSAGSRRLLSKFTYTPGAAMRLHCPGHPDLTACFVDVGGVGLSAIGAGHWRVPVGSGLLFIRLMRFMQGGGGSPPWVACAQAGCCCGGENCHE